jgi:hypothetical protein
MKILELEATDGPNKWSNSKHKLITLKLDLEDLEEMPSNKIDGFYERLSEMIPTMESHRCSKGYRGGFFERVKEGTWMGHIIEHIALEIQTLAGMDCGFGRTRGAGSPGTYNVIFNYVNENAGKYAALAAIKIAESIINNESYDLKRDIYTMKDLNRPLLENYIFSYDKFLTNESKLSDLKDKTLDKARSAKNLSKNILGAFKEEGRETGKMFAVFSRKLREKLNLKNRKDNPSPEEMKEALKQLKDIPKLAPYALILLAAPIPGSSALYTIFAFFLNKKSKGRINLLPSSFQNVLNVHKEKE